MVVSASGASRELVRKDSDAKGQDEPPASRAKLGLEIDALEHPVIDKKLKEEVTKCSEGDVDEGEFPQDDMEDGTILRAESSGDLNIDRIKAVAEKQGLDFQAVMAGIQKELAGLIDFDVFEEVDLKDVPEDAVILGTTLVLKQKGPVAKARVCAQDFKFKMKNRDDVFAPTPSTAALRALLVIAGGEKLVAATGDFTMAFLHVLLREKIFVWPPGVCTTRAGKVWMLKRALYGMRIAPKLFSMLLASVLKDYGMEQSLTEPTVYHRGKLRLLVHVDDPLAVGPQDEIN